MAALIEAALLQDLRHSNPQGTNRRITLALETGDEIVGGLDGATSYGWLLIKTLWVAPPRRRSGLGRALVAKAGRRALGFDCHHAWLDTSDPGARRFYERIGFSVFGSLQNGAGDDPEGHRRWFLSGPLDMVVAAASPVENEYAIGTR